MAEVVGLTLASASICFQLLAGCIRGFTMISEACSMTKDASLLCCMINLEEQKLLAWARTSGLIDNKMDPRLNTQLIQQSLSELNALFSATDKLLQYGLSLDIEEGADMGERVLRSHLMPLSPDRAQTDPLAFEDAKSKCDRLNIFRRAELTGLHLSFRRRVRWVIFDKERSQKLLRDIHALTDSLQCLLDDIQQRTIVEDVRLLKMQLIALSSKVEDMGTFQRADRLIEGRHTEVSQLADIRSIRIQQDQHLYYQNPHPLDPNKFFDICDTKSSYRAVARYQDIPVLIEWKYYTPDGRSLGFPFNIEKRVTDLVLLLSRANDPAFCVPQCLGYFKDESYRRFAFVFKSPDPEPKSLQLISLLELLRTSCKPALTARIQLAARLTKHVLHLITVNWFHKGIRAENILFMGGCADPAVRLANPWILGYEFARPNSVTEFSEKPVPSYAEDIYRHACAQPESSNDFKPQYDVYSLGLVLLEIAKWRPLKRIIKNVPGLEETEWFGSEKATRLQNYILDQSLEDNVLTDVAFRCGIVMSEVIKYCLSFPNEGLQRPFSKEILQEDFFTNVVRKLGNCRI